MNKETIKFFQSVKFRLTVWYLIVISILLFIFALVSYLTLYHNLYQNLDDNLMSRLIKLRDLLQESGDNVDIDMERELGEIILIYYPDGILWKSSGPFIDTPDIVPMVQEVAKGAHLFFNITTTYGWGIRFYASPVTIEENSFILLVGRHFDEIETILARLRTIFILSGLAMIVLAGIGGLFLANRALHPVDRITRTAQKIGEGSLSHRIEIHGEDELGRLALTLNQMIARLEDAFSRQQQFAADASHELRTPLSVIQAEATLALDKERSEEEYRKALEAISQEVFYMSSIIDKLLFLARSDTQREQYHFKEVNIRELIIDLLTNVEVLAQEKGLELEIGTIEDLAVRGDRDRLKQLFFNLLENAIKYTSKGKVSISAVQRDKMAVVAIADTGIGIPTLDLPHIFERFWRVDKARSREKGGTGLGLAIAQEIAKAHGGKIEVESKLNKGSTFSVMLPIYSVTPGVQVKRKLKEKRISTTRTIRHNQS
jgi:heavy metal sensor kinase